jgi:uncharacterized protein YndB with AHSA1/START domain
VNESLETVDGRSVLRVERRLAHAPEKVWRALTEPAHLTKWFPSDMEMDLTVGGKISFIFRQGEGPNLDGVITELDPPRVFAYTWADSLLRWELRPEGAGSLLTLVQTFDDRPAAASFAAGWNTCLDGMDAALSGTSPAAPADWVALHEGFIETFALTDGSCEDTEDGWRVRFERQLTRPVDAVWAVLNGPDQAATGAAVPRPFTTPAMTAGTVTTLDPPALLEYDWQRAGRPAGRIRWELRDGNGGARLVVTQTGPREATTERSAALESWQARIEDLARDLRSGSTR